jgi:sialic acid synthase SpsE
MTATILQKHVKYVTNAKGQAADILISLKNKEVREYIEDLMDAQEAMARDDGDTIPWEEVKANLYKKLD